MSATVETEKRRAAAAEKKAAAASAAVLAEAEAAKVTGFLDLDLIEAECGWAFADPPQTEDDQQLAAWRQSEAAERKRLYAEKFAVKDRGSAGWAARKISEARADLEAIKQIARAQVRGAERLLEWRRECFESQIRQWALTQPPDQGTKGSIRLIEHRVRLELRDADTGGPRIFDEADLTEELIEKLGVLEACDLGLIELQPQLNVAATKEFVENHPGMYLENAICEPRGTTKQLRIANLARGV